MTNWECFILIFPVLTRLVIVCPRWKYLRTRLPEEKIDQDTHRAILLPMAGFSFTGLVALLAILATVTNPTERGDLEKQLMWPILYLLISFLFYISATNIQTYKMYRWLDQLSDFLTEVAALLLILSIVVVVRVTITDLSLVIIITLTALSLWLINHLVRVGFTISIIENERKREAKNEQQGKS